MTKTELLQKYLDIASRNLLYYSNNYLMTRPKAGYESLWAEKKAEVKLLEEMIEAETAKEVAPEVPAPEQLTAIKNGIEKFGVPRSVQIDNPFEENEATPEVPAPEQLRSQNGDRTFASIKPKIAQLFEQYR